MRLVEAVRQGVADVPAPDVAVVDGASADEVVSVEDPPVHVDHALGRGPAVLDAAAVAGETGVVVPHDDRLVCADHGCQVGTGGLVEDGAVLDDDDRVVDTVFEAVAVDVAVAVDDAVVGNGTVRGRWVVLQTAAGDEKGETEGGHQVEVEAHALLLGVRVLGNKMARPTMGGPNRSKAVAIFRLWRNLFGQRASVYSTQASILSFQTI